MQNSRAHRSLRCVIDAVYLGVHLGTPVLTFLAIGLKTIYLNVKKSNVAANGLYQKFGCIETTAEELGGKGITLYLPEIDEEMNWYVIPNRYVSQS